MFTAKAYLTDTKRNTRTLINKYTQTFQTLKQAKAYANMVDATYGRKKAFEYKATIVVVNECNEIIYQPNSITKLWFKVFG